jgi:predicted nuclease of predicted toxin-antitoxin system
MSVRFKVDENLPVEVAELLSAHGHDASTVAAQGWTGVTDAALWPQVQEERRWLITADKGFANLRHHPPGSHVGVILLRTHEESRRTYLGLAAIALERLTLDELSGAIVVVTERGIRMRRAQLK